MSRLTTQQEKCVIFQLSVYVAGAAIWSRDPETRQSTRVPGGEPVLEKVTGLPSVPAKRLLAGPLDARR
jgi:hypothetical protein